MSGTLPQCVLVVDDDEGVALTFSRMLRLQGYRVETATNAETGLALATAHKPDAIILDLRMPIFGGVEFLRRLRSANTDPASRAPSVTIVTGDYFIEEPIASELRQLGAQVCFKPLWIDDLVDVVGRMLAPPPPSADAGALIPSSVVPGSVPGMVPGYRAGGTRILVWVRWCQITPQFLPLQWRTPWQKTSRSRWLCPASASARA